MKPNWGSVETNEKPYEMVSRRIKKIRRVRRKSETARVLDVFPLQPSHLLRGRCC